MFSKLFWCVYWVAPRLSDFVDQVASLLVRNPCMIYKPSCHCCREGKHFNVRTNQTMYKCKCKTSSWLLEVLHCNTPQWVVACCYFVVHFFGSMSHPDEISAKEGRLGSAEKSSSRWPYGWSKLAAADLPSQYLAGCVSAWRVLRTIAFFFSLQNYWIPLISFLAGRGGIVGQARLWRPQLGRPCGRTRGHIQVLFRRYLTSWTNEWMAWLTDRPTGWLTDRLTEWMNEGRKDGRMDGRMHGYMDEWMDH